MLERARSCDKPKTATSKACDEAHASAEEDAQAIGAGQEFKTSDQDFRT
jgi:hypothetical protein